MAVQLLREMGYDDRPPAGGLPRKPWARAAVFACLWEPVKVAELIAWPACDRVSFSTSAVYDISGGAPSTDR
jgi:hypothetical protein